MIPNTQSNPTEPPRFRDGQGHEWSIRLTLGLIESVQDSTQVDLIPQNCDVSFLTGLLFDPRKLSRVLWALIKSKAEVEGVTWESFRDSLDGESLSQGWNALVEAVLFFTRSQSEPLARTIEEAIEAAMRMVERGTELIREQMASQQTEAMYVENVRRELASTFDVSVMS